MEVEGLTDLESIGRGGSADVYLATDTESGERVAVKVYRLEASTSDFGRLFLRECAAAEALPPHPNIVTIRRSGVSASGHPYVVLDAANRSLADLLAAGPLDVTRAQEMAAEIAEGLRAAHEHGVLHRDVKPSNVLLDNDDPPRLADFGIASVVDASITTSDSISYTLAYAPPELIRGRPADERSDVYALGATIFEMLEGRPPFAERGLTNAEIMGRALRTRAPRLSRDGVPDTVRNLVATMLDVEPAKRPPLERVIAVLRGEPVPRLRRPRRQRRRAAIGAGLGIAVVVAVLAGSLAAAAKREDETAASTSTTTTVPPDQWVEGTDESAELAAAAGTISPIASALVGLPHDRAPLTTAGYFAPSAGFPDIPQLPSRTRWRFTFVADWSVPGCRVARPPTLTMTGFAGEMRTSDSFSVIVAAYAFADETEAAHMFEGRTISLGLERDNCQVHKDELVISQRDAPWSWELPWADEVSSWRLAPPNLFPAERSGYFYLLRVGRRIWEIRVAERAERLVPEGDLQHLLKTVGEAAETARGG